MAVPMPGAGSPPRFRGSCGRSAPENSRPPFRGRPRAAVAPGEPVGPPARRDGCPAFTGTEVERVVVLGFLGLRAVYLLLATVGVASVPSPRALADAAVVRGGGDRSVSVPIGLRLVRDGSLLTSRWPLPLDWS
jgi:hypothetical protein